MRVVVSERASDDIDAAFDYLAARSPNAARRLIDQLDRTLAGMTRFPLMGRNRSDLRPSLRSQIAGNYMVLYSIDGDDVIVVLDSRMNIDPEVLE